MDGPLLVVITFIIMKTCLYTYYRINHNMSEILNRSCPNLDPKRSYYSSHQQRYIIYHTKNDIASIMPTMIYYLSHQKRYTIYHTKNNI